MISLDKCKEILNCNGNNYTNEQVKLIRETLDSLACVIYESKHE